MRSLLLLAMALAVALLGHVSAAHDGEPTSFSDFTVPDLQGRQVSMREFNAFPVILVVNVASECGYTDKNYRELQELYEKYHDEGFTVLGFPCNQFGGQEPGTAEDILKFTQEKYRVTFPLFSKVDDVGKLDSGGVSDFYVVLVAVQVDVNGENAHPLFRFLKKQLDGFITNDIKWNFTKFLIVNHEPLKRYGTTTSPLEIEDDIVQALRSSRHVDEFDDGGATDGDHHDEL